MTMTIDHPLPTTVDPREGTRLLSSQERLGLARVLQERRLELGTTGAKESWTRIIARGERLGLSAATINRYAGYERTNEKTLERLADLFKIDGGGQALLDAARQKAFEQGAFRNPPARVKKSDQLSLFTVTEEEVA